MTSWQKLLKNSITTSDELAAAFSVNRDEIASVARQYPMRINPYYLGLIKEFGAPLFAQAVPDAAELDAETGMIDPLGEEDLSPVAGLVHKYPDRALFLIHNECAVYCRFCTRKRLVGRTDMVISEKTIKAGLDYLKQTPQIREVLLSGGDPLLLSDRRLESIVSRVRDIPSIEIIRIGSRVPCTLPMRVTSALAAMLAKYHPLYINTHFNHPAEITNQAEKACITLADAGIPLGCQTVLLKGINDDADVLRELFCKLLQIRVKPYYLFQADLTKGTGHFRTPIVKGIGIMQQLIGHLSGMAVPTFALDAPGGGGKIPLTPDYITGKEEHLSFCNYLGQEYHYPLT